MKIKANLILPSSKELAKMTGLDKGGQAQKYIDNFVLYHSKPYLPGERHLHDSGVSSTKIGSGQVVWNSPDANYLYEGKLMVDPKYKVGGFPIRGGKISFDENDGPIEGFISRKGVQKIMDPKKRELSNVREQKDHWFDRMIEDEMDNLVDGVQQIVNGGKQNG